MKHVINFGGGLYSWAAARRVVDTFGTKDVTLLFADTKMEDADMPRFLLECSQNLGISLTVIQDGRTPWEVFKDERFLGNSRVDPCSKILKRQLLDKWHKDNCDPLDTVIYVGLGWDEYHRVERFKRRLENWTVSAPLCEPPYLTKNQIASLAESFSIQAPRLHREGFPHNNCGGFCIKAGQAQFKRLLQVRPELYAFHEGKEQEFRTFIGKDVSILREQSKGVERSLTLRVLRERIEKQLPIDEFDWGGCGCAV